MRRCSSRSACSPTALAGPIDSGSTFAAVLSVSEPWARHQQGVARIGGRGSRAARREGHGRDRRASRQGPSRGRVEACVGEPRTRAPVDRVDHGDPVRHPHQKVAQPTQVVRAFDPGWAVTGTRRSSSSGSRSVARYRHEGRRWDRARDGLCSPSRPAESRSAAGRRGIPSSSTAGSRVAQPEWSWSAQSTRTSCNSCTAKEAAPSASREKTNDSSSRSRSPMAMLRVG